MFNIDVRDEIRRSGYRNYEIAAAVGLSETAFSRQMARAELPQDKKDYIIATIQQMRAERMGQA